MLTELPTLKVYIVPIKQCENKAYWTLLSLGFMAQLTH